MVLASLTEDELTVLTAMQDMPLPTVGDIKWAVQRRVPNPVEDCIENLRESGLVESEPFGFLGPREERFYLTKLAQEELQITGASWQQPACLLRLHERLSAVEWLYPAAGAITALGSCIQVQWFDGVSFDMAVRYEHGWIAYFWVGLLRTEKLINERFQRLGKDLADLACGDPHPRPSRLCVVVPDQWEAELVRRVVGRLRMAGWVTIWCIGDGTWHGARSSQSARGWVYQPVYRRDVEYQAWETKVRESWWSREGNRNPVVLLRRVRPALRTAMGNRHVADRWVARVVGELEKAKDPAEAAGVLRSAQDDLKKGQRSPEAAAIVGRIAGFLRNPDPDAETARLLLAVAEWPGISTGMAQVILGEGPTGRRAQRALLRMHDWGIVQRRRDGKKIRYRISWAGFQVLAGMDRTSPESVWNAIQMKRWDAGGGFETHEYGVMDVGAQFLAAGCPVANGWRDNEVMGFSGGVVPDSMVWLERTPFQPGWHYLEYERSARATARVTAKLTGFDSPLRVNIWPVLMVAADDAAEQAFHDVGERMGITMLTTTIARVAEHGPVGSASCWRVPEYLARIHSAPPVLG